MAKKTTLAQAKKAANTPAYKTTGSITARAEERLRFYLQNLPQELQIVRASLLPFDDVVTGGCCGGDDTEFLGDYGTGKPYFMVEISDPQNATNEYQIVVTASAVFATLVMNDGKGGAEYDEPVQMSIGGLYEFLRQLPRGAHAFEGR